MNGQCVPTEALADGATCDTGMVCLAGACVACEAVACEPSGEECKTGTAACGADAGAGSCVVSGNAPNGTPCSSGVCLDGACTPCVADQPCQIEGSCYEGRTSCVTGEQQCVATGTALAEGTSCYTDSYCYSGSCETCTPGGTCYPEDPCKVGAYTCVPERYGCEPTGDAADGTWCGSDQVCESGSCVACVQGGDCVPDSNPCKLGLLDCSAGPSCVEQADNAPDGTTCGVGLVCAAGGCVGSDRVLDITAGAAQTKRIGEASALVQLLLEDTSGTPIEGATITISAPAGADAPAEVTTAADGTASFQVRAGRAVGTQVFTLETPGASPQSVTLTATPPSTGHIFTLINADHEAPTGLEGPLPQPGSAWRPSYAAAEDMVIASDGTVYFTDGCTVPKLTPEGQLERLVGNIDGECGFGGDLGPAQNAHLHYATGLALDEANGLLYIADSGNGRIRVVDLASEFIDTLAGGGDAPPPNYGDDGPPRDAVLNQPAQLAVAPDGAVIVVDDLGSGAPRLRKVAADGTLVTHWFGGECLSDELGMNAVGDVVFNADGAAFVLGSMCGLANGDGVVRRDVDGTVTLVAGAGATAPSAALGVAATDLDLSSASRLALDPGGNLYISLPYLGLVLRVDGASGLATIAAGAASGGSESDYVSAASAALAQPWAIGTDASGHLYGWEADRYALRSVWQGASTTPSSATLSIQSGNAQSAAMGSLLTPLAAKLVDGAGAVLRGVTVAWSALDAGSGVYLPSSRTNLSGVASVSARTGLQPGEYQYEAAFRTIHGEHVVGSPVTYTITANAPTSGHIFPLINFSRGSNIEGVPGPGLFAGIGRPEDVVVASDGTTYVSGNCAIYRLSPAGHLAVLAGSIGDCGFAGETGLAINAQLTADVSLALDEPRGLLYLADNDRIRRIHLATGLIEPFAGGGLSDPPGDGDGGLATAAYTPAAKNPSVDSAGDVYFKDLSGSGFGRMRRVVAATGQISNWLTTEASCTGSNTGISSFGSYSDQAFDNSDNAYILAQICAPGVYGATGILRRTPAGSLTHIAGGDYTASGEVEGIDPKAADLSSLFGMAVRSSSEIYVTTSTHRVRRIGASSINTVVGDGVSGYSEYVSATSSRANSPYGIAIHPDGGFVFADYDNYAVRRVAP